MMEEQINGRTIKIPNNKFQGKLSIEEYEKQIYSSFKKIGVSQDYITMTYKNHVATVSWVINNQKFSFTSKNQEDLRSNIGSISMAILEDIRQIQRGIKNIFMIMKQYSDEEVTPDKRKDLNFFTEKSTVLATSEPIFNMERKEEILILSKDHARKIISDIKVRYPLFKDFKYLPEEEKRVLRSAYYYLNLKVNF